MLKISDETKVGVVTALAITLLVIAALFLKGYSFFGKKKVYYAIYSKVDGLEASDPVILNGLLIGKIESLEIMDGREGKIIAEVLLEKEVKIPKNSSFEIFTPNFLKDGKAVRLILGDSQDLAQINDTIAGTVDPFLIDIF